jgi:hypothetical protein
MTLAESLGLSVGIIAIVAPELWPHMSKAISFPVATVGFLLLAWSGILALEGVTGMRIQFGPLVVLVCAAILAAVGVFWHIHLSRAQSVPPPPERGSLAVPQNPPVDNRGGIIIHGNNSGNPTVNNFGSLPPTYKALGSEPVRDVGNGVFVLGQLIEVISQSPPNNMLVVLQKNADIVEPDAGPAGIQSLEVRPYSGGSTSVLEGETPTEYWHKLSTPAAGKYLIRVRTRNKNAKLAIGIAFNVPD